ncbi:MAG: hypothetical protein QXJ06_00235 [Candidatus Aenigmatarchaeota archaeon]
MEKLTPRQRKSLMSAPERAIQKYMNRKPGDKLYVIIILIILSTGFIFSFYATQGAFYLPLLKINFNFIHIIVLILLGFLIFFIKKNAPAGI